MEEYGYDPLIFLSLDLTYLPSFYLTLMEYLKRRFTS